MVPDGHALLLVYPLPLLLRQVPHQAHNTDGAVSREVGTGYKHWMIIYDFVYFHSIFIGVHHYFLLYVVNHTIC